MKIVKQNGVEFVTELDKLEFLECYLFLTTRPMNSIVVSKNGQTLSGLANSITSVSLYHPNNPVSEVCCDNQYWINYSWVWQTTEQGNIHFKMTDKTEYVIPPIPKSLYEMWEKFGY